MYSRLKRRFAGICTAFLVLVMVFSLAPSRVSAFVIDDEDPNPIILIDKLSAEQAVAGGEFNLTLGLRNITNKAAVNLKVEFKLEDADSLKPFTLKNPEAAVISQLEGNSSKTVFFTFAVDEAAQNKDYKLRVNVSGQNGAFQNTVNTSSAYIIPVTYDLTKPVLIIKEASISPENPDLIEGFTVHLQVWNLSKTTDARNVVLLLDGKDNFEVMEISNKKNLAKLEKGQYETVSYKLKAKDTKDDNTVKMKIDYDYLGDQSVNMEETVNLPLPAENTAVGATPWVIINKYTLSAERVLAGNTVTLSLSIENTNQRPVKNVKISLGVIKIEETSGSSSSTTTGGTVFSPVNSSNSFYIESIPAKTVLTKDIDLFVDPNATAKTYIVPVTIKYEDRKGTTLTSEEMVNIPVTQNCKLQILSLQVPPVGFTGQPIPITAEFVNVGKVALGNFMVSLEGDFEKENGSYYVGNLDIGVSDYFQGSAIPREEGTLEGKVVFSYIDNNNKDVREESPFTIEIQNQPQPIPGKDGEMIGPGGPVKVMPGRNAAPSGGFAAKVKKWAVPLLMFAVIIGEAVYIRRLKKERANGEFFDE